MAYKIVISPLAHEDEYEAYKWYEDARAGLGEELLYELDIAYQKIANHPQAFGCIDAKKKIFGII
ncbi:MAG: hypothetical protein V4722_14325 [Bacteroidota bacterium]